MAKKKKENQNPPETYQAEVLDTSLDAELKKYEKTDFTSLIKQVESEYQLSWWYMKPKFDEWALRLKLYNNQRRDKEAVGDPLLFTIHQTVLASLYSDRLGAEFVGREDGDDDVTDNLNALAIYDADDMEKDIADYEWDWDASFFGRGLELFMDFDRDTKTPIPEVIDMMTWLRDPRAKSVRGDRRGRGRMRFGGREIRLTNGEMKDAGVYFDLKGIKPDSYNDIASFMDQNTRLRAQAQGMGDINNFKNLEGENRDYRLLEWFTMWKGELVLVALANNRKKIVRFTPLKKNYFPILDRTIYPIAHDWDGVSIPDLTEDKQRARSVVQNLGLKSAKAGLNPMYVYNTNKIKNKNDLNFDFNKFVGIDGDPNNAVLPIQRDGVKQEVQWIMNVLATAAEKATATPDMQQGATSDTKRTATELSIVNNKVDTRYSLSAKIFGWSEKRFWQEWYRIYKRHFTAGIDEKMVRIAGAMGYTRRKLTRENIIAKGADPDVMVESKIISDAQRAEKLNAFRNYVKDMQALDPSANMRFALRQLGKLSGLQKDEIDRMLPPTIDELLAEKENESLEKDKMVEVNLMDDDMTHIEIHNKAADTKFKYAHIEAHKRNMLLKKEKPDLFPQANNKGVVPTADNEMGGGAPSLPAGAGGGKIPMIIKGQ